LWDETQTDHPVLEEFLDDPTQILQTISLCRTGHAEKKNILNLKSDGFEADWQTAVRFLNESLAILRSDLVQLKTPEEFAGKIVHLETRDDTMLVTVRQDCDSQEQTYPVDRWGIYLTNDCLRYQHEFRV